MDDFDQDLAAHVWSGGEPTTVIDEPADLDDLIPAGPDLAAAIEADPAPVLPDSGTAGEAFDDIPDLTAADPESVAPAAADDSVHGNPAAWTLNWFYQQINGYCGPSAVGQIVAQYTGATITDPQELVDRAVELGLMGDPGEGMTLPNIEKLLEDQGVPCSLTSSSLDDLRAKLDDGYGVIAMVDSGEIWHPDQETDDADLPDHVLVVAGIDDERGVVILSDPGVPNGDQLEVPIEQFDDAWADSEHQMVVTDAPDAGLLDTPATTTAPSSRSVIIRV
ncbi:C39 family peptidase [Rhodococcus sp. TAF43]|uniref:C39 family peptidase n=1 Tax=Rhodococcus sp. TAF43 TaxID=3237483 RepID=UPI003F978959